MFQDLYEKLKGMDEGATALRKQYVDSDKMPAETFANFEREDPTKTKKYLGWMLKQYLAYPVYSVPTITMLINRFHEYVEQNKIENKDILSYKNVTAVQDVVDAAYKKRSRSEVETEAKEGADIVQRDDKFILVYVESPDAMTYYSKGTKWCISDPDTFMEYVEDSNMCFYVAITKNDISLSPDPSDTTAIDEYAFGDKFVIVITSSDTYVIYDELDDEVESGSDINDPDDVLLQMGKYGLDLSKLKYQENEYLEDYREEQQREKDQEEADRNYDETLSTIEYLVDVIFDAINDGDMKDDYAVGEEATVEKIALEVLDDELNYDDYVEGPYRPDTEEVRDAMVSLGYIYIATNIDTIKAHIKDFEQTRQTTDAAQVATDISSNIVQKWVDDIDNIVDLEIKSREALLHMEPTQIIAYMKQLVIKWEEQHARKDVKGQRQFAFDSLQLKQQLSILWEYLV